MQRPAVLQAGIPAELLPELALAFGVLPGCAVKTVVVTAALRRQPDLVQRLLQVDNQLAFVGKAQGDHAAHALVVYVQVVLIIELIAQGFQSLQQGFCMVHEFVVGHLGWLQSRRLTVQAVTHKGLGTISP